MPRLILAVVVIACAGCRTTEPVVDNIRVEPVAEMPACPQLKADIAKSPVADARLVAFTLQGDTLPAWKLRLGGMEVAVPEATYEVLPVSATAVSVGIVLKAENWELAMHRDSPLPPVDDPLDSGKPSPEWREESARVFGHLPTLHEILLEGFRHGPADLSCDPARSTPDTLISIALVMKTTAAPPVLVSAHHDHYGLGDLAMLGQAADGRWIWQVLAPVADGSYNLVWSAKDRAVVERLARTATVRPLSGPPLGGPAWLVALGDATVRPDQPAPWQLLEAELAKAGASPRSIEAVRKVREQPGT